MTESIPRDPGALVEAYLRTIMVPDPEGARRFVAPGLEIVFTGGRAMHDPAECAAFNATRYRRVRKRFEHTHVVPQAAPGEAVVYNTGTLEGAWLDGTPFEGIRYVDRYLVRDGLIVRMEVWNDTAERLLLRQGAAAP